MQCDYDLIGIDVVQRQERFVWKCSDCGHRDVTENDTEPRRQCPALTEGNDDDTSEE